MPTTDERRQVAARLREYIDFNFEDSNPYWYVMKAIYGDVAIHDDNELFNRLADLIEPEERTCTFTDNWNDPDLPLPTCSACGWEAEETDCVCVIGGPMFQYDGKFCKECGAKVMGE